MLFRVQLITFLFIGFTSVVYAQFYNGTKMDFGKNRVQFSDYLWSHYKYEHFNIYFYEDGKHLADYAARSAQLQLKELEFQFEYQFKGKIQFVIYNTQNQSRESNIGNYPDEDLNPGGFARIIGDKVFLFFDGDHQHFDRQIRNGVAQILLDNIIFGDGTDEFKNEALINFPDWFYNGLTAYLTEKWSVEIEGEVKSHFQSGKFGKFNWLRGREAVLAGRSVWYYIADFYGEEAVSNVLYMSKISRSYSDGILFVLGKSVDNLLQDWEGYFQSRFMLDNQSKTNPEKNNVFKRPYKSRDYQRPKLNKSGSHLALVTHKLSQHKVYVYDIQKKKKKCVLKIGHKIDLPPDHSFPVLAWHPSGDLLTVFFEQKGKMIWMTYNTKTHEKTTSKLFQLEKILEANYASNGKKIALSAVVKGKTDIYILDVLSRFQEQITNDFYDDRDPIFLNQDSKIIFSSNRINDTMRVDGNMNYVYPHNYDLFQYNYSAKKSYKFQYQVLLRLSSTTHANEHSPYSMGLNTYHYLSDQNGVNNLWSGKIDSAVTHVDTTIHYRYFAQVQPMSNYNSNILWHHSNGKDWVRIFRPIDRNRIHISSIVNKPLEVQSTTDFMNFLNSDPVDSTPKIRPMDNVKILTVDSIKNRMIKDPDFLFTDYYIFRDEMDKQFNDSVIEVVKQSSNTAFQPLKINGFPTSDSLAPRAKQRNYELSFRTAEVSLDVDNRFLNPVYQRFSGGASYPMPGMNGFMKYSIIDLLEDHLITGGFRISDFYSHEFFLSYANRKKRLDKQILLYRSTHTDLDDISNVEKNIIYEGVYRLDYPFSIVDRISASISVRYDQRIPLSKNINLLKTPISHQFWPTARVSYVFDNTRSLGVNLLTGLRCKLFTEFYQEVPVVENRMLTFGADIRTYKKIYKSLIWANRFAGGSSIGTQRLMFYMGGVDSWVLPKFNQKLEPSKLMHGNYAFQTLATNMRGFIQNARNGSSFIAVNSEIRWPVLKFLFSRPFSSDFLNNLQCVGFADVGTAWSGSSPFSEDNSLNQQTLVIGEEARTGEIRLKTNKEPIIGGGGFGIRSSIFGYFVRADWAWGIEDGIPQERQFYLSLTADF